MRNAKIIARATIGKKSCRKYGFHGLSKKAAKRAAARAGRRADRLIVKISDEK